MSIPLDNALSAQAAHDLATPRGHTRKDMPKHIAVLTLIAAGALSLPACGGGGSTDANAADAGTLSSDPTVQILHSSTKQHTTPAPAPLVSATPPTTSGALITDRRVIAMPTLAAYPAKGSSRTDPVTGFVSTRVADKSELVGDYGAATPSTARSAISAIVYARYTPSNTTGDYVLVHGDNSTSAWVYRVADNKMMTILRFNPALGQSSRSLGEVNELRWDYSGAHPYRLYFTGRSIPKGQGKGENVGMSFYFVDFNPASGTHAEPVLVHDFSAEFPSAAYPDAEIMNDVEGDSSNDSRYWAWQVMNTSLGSGYKPYAVVSYDKTSDAVLGRLQRSCTGSAAPCTEINTPATAAPYLTRPNMVEMSPLGTRVIVHWDRSYAGNNEADSGSVADGPKGFAPNFSDPIRIGSGAQHSGWAWSRTGSELFVYQNSRNDWIEAVDVTSAAAAKCTVISGNSYSCGTKLIKQPTLAPDYNIGFHFGKIYDRSKRGYAYMSTYNGNNNAWGKNQELLLAIRDGSAAAGPHVVRLGSTYNTAYDYRSEGSGALSFDATSIWATANWAHVDGRGDTLRIQLPPNLWAVLPLQ
jgi:hypothetical protein